MSRCQSVPAAEEEIDETRQAGEQAAEQFSRLCESVKDLSPKEQVSRVHEHFGILEERRPRRAEVPVGNVASSWRRIANLQAAALARKQCLHQGRQPNGLGTLGAGE